jgi:hypothetical protein
MSELDIVKGLAKQALIIRTRGGGGDKSLWDRAQRLVRYVEYICRLPDLAGVSVQIDRFCLTAATYFSDAGLARYLESEKQVAKWPISDAKGHDLLDSSARVVKAKLADAIEGAKIGKINRIIIESGSRLTKMTEAMVLSDARNLDDTGVAGIFNEFRRYTIEGKGISDCLQSWKKKKDYRYWQARLKKSFRFEHVRDLAEERLAAAEALMNQLKLETEALDLEESIAESLERKQ